MSEPIKNRYEFVILFDVENGNPNGDPDAGNMPRVDPETGLGLVTDVCLKRKIRNYVETVKEDSTGYRIYIKDGVPLNRSDAEAYVQLDVTEKNVKEKKKADPDLDRKIRDWWCANFYDIRSFWRSDDNICKSCTQLWTGSRSGTARFCTQCRASCSPGNHHHPCCLPLKQMPKRRGPRWGGNILSPTACIGVKAISLPTWHGKPPASRKRI